jgi:uncharacterized protein (TIGR03067 family)
MGRTLFVAALLLAPVGLVLADSKVDTSKLTGTWKVTGGEKDGKLQASSDLKGKEVKITKDTITCTKDGKTEMACTYTVDTASKPWKIEMKCTAGEHKDKTLEGIIKMDGDKLTICHGKPGKAAPKDFTTNVGESCIKLEREK